MSLATRCPACGTIFRVVQDQLKVSEGWVRCGQCHEVFHGIEHLFDLGSDPGLASRRAARTAGAPTAGPQTGSGADTGPDSVPGFAPTRTPPLSTRRPVPAAPRTESGSVSRPMPMPGPSLRGEPSPAPTPAASRTPAFAPSQAFAPRPTPAPVPAPAPATVPPATPSPADLGDLGDLGDLDDFRVDDGGDDAFGATTAETTPTPVSPEPTAFPGPSAAPPPAVAPAPAPPPAVDEPGPEAAAPASADAFPPSTFRRRARALSPEAIEAGSTLPSRLADDGGPETLASRLPEIAGDWPPRRKPSRSAPAAAAATPAEGVDVEASPPDPRFLREARRAAFWNAPAIRVGLVVVLVVGTLAAVAQVTFPYRDLLAARWPATTPLWTALCEQAGCTVGPPRGLATLALDGTSLTRTEAEHVLLFSADLRNKAAWPVRMPAFDLKFTDLSGQVVARRVFTPAELGIAQAALSPDGELHVRARLHLDGLDVAGFQAEVFYP